MGEDNLRTFHKWFNYEQILRSYTFYVYPRLLTEQEEVELQSKGKDTTILYSDLPNVHMLKEAPLMKISASFIRDSIREGKDVRYLLTEPVQQYIDEMNFYK
jgi:nicotinate-nucleotide adenylyltransferase